VLGAENMEALSQGLGAVERAMNNL
jgi:hypothetical protein